MSIYSRKRTKRNSQNQFGHLKLSIREDTGALVVTVHEARGLKRRDGSPYDTYVKIYMLPDPGKHTKEKTKRVKEKDPVFETKFNFLLNSSEDVAKCLFISVWNRERAGRIDMIGCMTFKVSDLIQSNGINGWYQLLNEEKGRKENILVPSALHKMNSEASLTSVVSAPPALQTRNFAVTLVRSPKGYGFKVSVGTPVYISEVSEGLPAYQLDLKIGDMIIEVDGTDVRRANGEMVANMIKKHRDTLQMILTRAETTYSPISQVTSSSSMTSFPFSSHSLTDLSYNDIGIGAGRMPRRTTYNLPTFSSSQTTRFCSPEERLHHQPGMLSQPADFSDYRLEDPSLLHGATHFGRDRTAKSRERLPEVPEEYSSNTVNGRTTTGHRQMNNGLSRSSSQTSQQSSIVHESIVNPPVNFGYLSFSQPGGLDSVSTRPKNEIRKHSLGSPMDETSRGGLYDLAVNSMRSAKKGSNTRSSQRTKVSSSSVGSVGDSAYSTANSSRSLNQFQQDDHSLSPSIFDLQRGRSPPIDTAIQKISPTSPIFSDYSRHMSSSAEEMSPMMEWESLNKLEQKRQRFLNSLVKCEKEFFDELQRGVDLFLFPMSGVISDNSHRTIFMSLDRMCELSKYFYTQISQLMVQCNKAPPNVSYYIEEFATFYHNKLHLLKKLFEAYLRNSDSARKEIAVCFTNDEFKRIVKEPSILYSFVEAGTEYLPKMCRLLTGISYVTPLDHPDHIYLTDIINSLIELLPASCNDLRKNWKSEKGIMENLNSAISFTSSTVESFDIVKPGRVLLHEGEASLIEKRKKRKVWLLLFSDILVITKRSRHILSVTEDPFHLNGVVVQDINCELDEIQIATDDGALSRQFRFLSRHDRGVWLQKLKERATGSLKKTSSKQSDVISRKQDVLRSELEQELKTPYKFVQRKDEFGSEDSICANLDEKFDLSEVESNFTQVPVGSSPPREFIPPHASVVFPMSQPILPSKFTTLPSKKTEPKQSMNTRKISGLFKRRSADMSNFIASQSSNGFPSPVFTKTVKNDSSGSKAKTSRDESTILSRINRDRLERWSESLHELLTDSVGIRLFEEFLVKECSQENLSFWKACRKYTDPWTTPDDKLQSIAEEIFSEFISHQAPNLVNIDHTVRTNIMSSMTTGVTRKTFDQAVVSIYTLMERDSYSRFVKQSEFREALALSKVF